MDMVAYTRHMDAIKQAVESLFGLASTEEEVCNLEKVVGHEVTYLAGLAQAELAKPPQGWDTLGR